MKLTKKLTALCLAVILTLSAASALAAALEPEKTGIGRLAGQTVHATVGAWDADAKVFEVTVYDYDRFGKDDIEKLRVGDLLLAGGRIHGITEIGEMDGERMITCDGWEEFLFAPAEKDDEVIAMSTDDDRLYMRAIGIVYLPAAESIALIDFSDPDAEEPVVTDGLENILKIKAEKEETSNGLNFYATTVTVNESLEIETITQVFDVAQ